MADFLDRLIARSLPELAGPSQVPTAQPRVPGIFEQPHAEAELPEIVQTSPAPQPPAPGPPAGSQPSPATAVHAAAVLAALGLPARPAAPLEPPVPSILPIALTGRRPVAGPSLPARPAPADPTEPGQPGTNVLVRTVPVPGTVTAAPAAVPQHQPAAPAAAPAPRPGERSIVRPAARPPTKPAAPIHPPQQTVTVHIGRLEVTGAARETTPPTPRGERPQPRLRLNRYLAREGGAP